MCGRRGRARLNHWTARLTASPPPSAARPRRPPGRLEAADAFAAEQRALAASGRPSATAQPGTPLPNADLLDVTGLPITLTAAPAGRPAVIVFCRGGWCPYCNIALRTYQAQLVPRWLTRAPDCSPSACGP
jgi:AhpC/TSA family